MYELIEILIQRVNLLEEQVRQLQKSSVQKHYNPWPDSAPSIPGYPPYIPSLPWPSMPVVELTKEQEESFKKLMEQFGLNKENE